MHEKKNIYEYKCVETKCMKKKAKRTHTRMGKLFTAVHPLPYSLSSVKRLGLPDGETI